MGERAFVVGAIPPTLQHGAVADIASRFAAVGTVRIHVGGVLVAAGVFGGSWIRVRKDLGAAWWLTMYEAVGVLEGEGYVSMIEKVSSLLGRGGRREPVGTVRVVDPSPLNWLYITYNTVEELVRTSPDGRIVPAAMKGYRWRDGGHVLEVELRPGNRFQDGEALTAHSVKRGFDESMRWEAPHPPGTHFNPLPGTTCEVAGEYAVRFHLPAPDGLMLGKLRAIHIMSTRFWDEIGFGYERNGSGEGHW